MAYICRDYGGRLAGVIFGNKRAKETEQRPLHLVFSCIWAGDGRRHTGTGTDVKEIINRIIEADPDRRKVDDDDVIEEVVDTGYTVDENGNRVCNTAGYVYDAETDACVLASERKTVSRGLNRPRAASRFNTDYGTQTGRVNIAPLNEGGMVNTNRMVDEFLVALGA